jgi:hypothetical protein
VLPEHARTRCCFDTIPICEHWCEDHVKDQDGKREYDFDIHSITKFLKLCLVNNPNQIDLLFAHETLVKHCSQVGRMLLDNRRIFLSKLCWKRFRGYASDQFHKLKEKNPIGGRKALIEEFGYDVKFAYNCIRLLREAEQILTEGDLNLFSGNEEYKAIRRGEWKFDRLEQEFVTRKLAVESCYHNCKLPEAPDEDAVRKLLLDCLELHYGSLAKVVVRPDATVQALRDIDNILGKVRPML